MPHSGDQNICDLCSSLLHKAASSATVPLRDLCRRCCPLLGAAARAAGTAIPASVVAGAAPPASAATGQAGPPPAGYGGPRVPGRAGASAMLVPLADLVPLQDRGSESPYPAEPQPQPPWLEHPRTPRRPRLPPQGYARAATQRRCRSYYVARLSDLVGLPLAGQVIGPSGPSTAACTDAPAACSAPAAAFRPNAGQVDDRVHLFRVEGPQRAGSDVTGRPEPERRQPLSHRWRTGESAARL